MAASTTTPARLGPSLGTPSDGLSVSTCLLPWRCFHRAASTCHHFTENQSKSTLLIGNRRLTPESSLLVVQSSSGVTGAGADGSVDRPQFVQFWNCESTLKLDMWGSEEKILGAPKTCFQFSLFYRLYSMGEPEPKLYIHGFDHFYGYC